MKKILVFGGCGYVGSRLVEKLLGLNYQVIVYDLLIFGNHLKPNKNLKVIKGDVRDIKKIETIVDEIHTVIHLACVSNDPSFELNPNLSYEINFKFFEELVKICKFKNIKKFIFMSSSSVYGIKDEDEVIETMSLKPLTDYSKYKAKCEEVLLKHYDENFCTTILRPATVCGFSPRQRLDLVVNILTNFGYHKKKIQVFGGDQLRPNIHIDDICDAMIYMDKDTTKNINGEIFNVGFENYKVSALANKVKDLLKNNIEIEYLKSNDNRSYHISSNKILSMTDFKPKKNISIAIEDLISAFDHGKLKNTFENEEFFNIKKMQSINLV